MIGTDDWNRWNKYVFMVKSAFRDYLHQQFTNFLLINPSSADMALFRPRLTIGAIKPHIVSFMQPRSSCHFYTCNEGNYQKSFQRRRILCNDSWRSTAGCCALVSWGWECFISPKSTIVTMTMPCCWMTILFWYRSSTYNLSKRLDRGLSSVYLITSLKYC